jgi:L-iditol 2-dehydrogenase
LKVLRLHARGELRLHDEPTPTPKPDETLVHVDAVGICGSDLHWFEEGGIGDARLTQPLVLGHEFAGVTEHGERVAVDPAIPCYACEFCLEGNPNLCPNVRFAGHGSIDGAMRETIAWPTRNLYRMPEAMSDVEGAMLEPLGVALHAVNLGKLKPGIAVGVFGCGPIGLLVVQLARASGATQIIATDKLAHRREAAKAFGATQSFLSFGGDENDEIWRATHQRGVDLAFEVAGENEAVETAMAIAKPGGQVILVGIPANERTTFVASIARRKGLTIKLCRRMKHTYPRSIQLVESGKIDVRSIVTHQFALEQATQAFAVAQRREGLKVMVKI